MGENRRSSISQADSLVAMGEFWDTHDFTEFDTDAPDVVFDIEGAMRFTWHEPKRQVALKKRGLDFAHAEQVFRGPTFTFEDDREDYGERRWVTLGLLRDKVVVIVHTETEDEIRVISMREANSDEQILFFANL